MADRLETYAGWLVANKNKRGTPEYQKVADAYKQLRSMPAAMPKATDGPIAYSVDRAQQMLGKGVEVFGDLVGSETIKGFGSNVVAQQEKDIAAGGYKPTYTGSLSDTYKDGGIGAALGWIAEKTQENLASGGLAIAGTAATVVTAPFSAPAAAVLGGSTLVASGVMGAGETALEMEEKTGQYNSAVAAGTGVLIGILDKFGAGKVIPKDKLATMTGEEIIERLIKEGSQSSLDAATEIGKRITKSTVAEGATETAQEAAIVGATASQGGEYTEQELKDRALESFVLGGTMGAGTTGGIETGKAIKGGFEAMMPGGYNPSDQEAAGDLAKRLGTIAAANGLDLKDINKTSTKGARQAVDLAHSQIASEMKQLINDLKPKLKVGALDPIEVVVDKVLAEAGAKEARTKTKSIVGQQEMDATARLVGEFSEGQKLLRLFRQSNELTALHNEGYIGGVSQFTDQVSPIGSNVGYTAKSAAELPVRLLGTAAGTSINPILPAAQIGAVAAGRGIDALTGQRSVVNKFVKKNIANDGVDIGNRPSVRQQAIDDDAEAQAAERQREDARAARQAEKEAVQLENTRQGKRPAPKSPQETMERATGLDRSGVAAVLRVLKQRNNTYLKDLIDQYEQSVKTEGTVNDLTTLIDTVDTFVENNPEYQERRVAEPDRNRFNTQSTTRVTTGTAQLDARTAQGKADNQAFNDSLQQQLNEDATVSPQNKAVAGEALAKLRLDLGRNPVQTAEAILEEAKEKAQDPMVIDRFVGPYVQRVRRQQPKSETEVEFFVNQRLPEEAPPRRTHRQIGEILMEEQQSQYGRPLNPYQDEGDFNTIADAMTEEAALEYERSPDIATWYDDDIAEALETTSEVIPELKDNADNQALFLLLAALTSVGHKPRINWRYAGALAQHYFRTGEIGEISQVYSEKRGKSEERLVNPSTGNLFGLKAGSIEPGLRIFRHMVNTMGMENAIEWISSEKTKAEIDAMRKEAGYGPQGKIKGGKNAIVPGIQMFGPKVGPFYLNLQGIHEVTVDLWASRTVRRHVGDLLDPNFDPDNKKNASDSGLIDAPTEVERPTMKALYTRVGENLGVTPQAAQAILWKYEQELYNDLGAKLETEKFSEGAVLFKERDAVAYETRNRRPASGQATGTESNVQTETNFQRGDDSRLRDGLQQSQIAGPRPANPAEVRDARQAVDEVFEVGKPGSPYENGIPDIATAKRLANAIGYSLYLADTKSDLLKIFGKSSGKKNAFTKGLAQQAIDPNNMIIDQNTGEEVKGVIGVLGPYSNPRNDRETQTALGSIWTAMHELGHALESRFYPGGQQETQKIPFYTRFNTKREIPTEKVHRGTFREVITDLLNMIGDPSDPGMEKAANDIISEIVNMQRTGNVRGEEAVREDYVNAEFARNMAEFMGEEQRVKEIEDAIFDLENTYFHTPQELAADLIGMYLLDPNYAKAKMPNATKIVRKIFNKGPVTFYSMPFASLVAAVMANMLLAGEEEEREEGILTPPRGALTA